MSELKLYHGGCGTTTGYIVAKDEGKAIKELSDKLGVPFLPVQVEEITVDGYEISVVAIKAAEATEAPKKKKGKAAEATEAPVEETNGTDEETTPETLEEAPEAESAE